MAINISEFELWQPGYGGAIVIIYQAGTTTPASIFTDEALSVSAANPQTLDERTIGDVVYGKWHVPIYTASAYQLSIDSTDVTGIHRATISSLAGQDASAATAIPTGASVADALSDHLGRIVWAEDHGTIGASASTNTATITAAIGRAVALGATEVRLPPGTIPFTALSIPAGVQLVGYGRSGLATVLQSQTAGACVTLSGDGAGLRDLVLDGLTLPSGSIGIYAKAKNETVMDNVLVKRFATGIHFKGGKRAHWSRLFVDNCAIGASLNGDSDAGGGGGGGEFSALQWTSGRVSACSSSGVRLSYEDRVCENNNLRGVTFESNTGAAISINGARFTDIQGSDFLTNTINLFVQDDSDPSQLNNIVIGLKLRNGRMTGGAVVLSGNCQDVVFDAIQLANVDFALSQPANNILLRDCTEDFEVTYAGDGTRVLRTRAVLADAPNSAIITTTGSPNKAWELTLNPGEKVMVDATIIGVGQNKAMHYLKRIARFAHLPGSTLAYDTQVTNFTLGAIVTGGTSGAIGRIIADSDSGATGTLTLRDIVGSFIDNEQLTDSSGGAALANGLLVLSTVTLLGSETALMAEVTTGSSGSPSCAIAANGQQVQVNVTGVAAEVIDWTVGVSAVIG